jgi:hypothetical protein
MVENVMTITNPANTSAVGPFETSFRPVQEQLDLTEAAIFEHPDIAETRVDGMSMVVEGNAPRAFVPSNRERILRQLSALVLSPDFPPLSGIPSDDLMAPVIIHDGLRSSEIDVLADGRSQRFPVLAEIRTDPGPIGRSAFGILDVVALHFRNEKEASDFRFRPVDELDTEHFRCLATPSLFALDGEARFDGLERNNRLTNNLRSSFADRIGGAINSLMELSSVAPECRQAIADLLSRQGQVAWLESLSALFLRDGESGNPGAHGAIIRAFLEHEGASSNRLVAEIGERLGELPDPDVLRALPVWLEAAGAVLSNQMVLDGKALSDSGLIALRAAILAVVVDEVKDLAAFLYSERPAGRQVVVAAAFLIGLRTGVADLSWQKKLPHLGLLSPLLMALHHHEDTARLEALAAFQVEPDESASQLELILYWCDRQLIRWMPQPASGTTTSSSPVASPPLDIEVATQQELSARIAYSDRADSLSGPDGRVAEIIPKSSPDQPISIRLVLGESDRLRKPKELLEASCTPGIYWRAGVSADGTGALHVDILHNASDEVIDAMMLKLPAALLLYLVPVKPKRSVKAPSVKKPKTPSLNDLT